MVPQISTPLTQLQSLQQTLHLLHHRNHNQHRLAKWYSSFSIFRRQIAKFTIELQAHNAAYELNPKSRYTTAAREKLVERIEFLGARCVGSWYLAFSNVVADNQYAALGLMLIGSLARFVSVMKEVGRDVGVEVNFGTDEDVYEEVKGDLTKDELVEGPVLVGADLGEVIQREVPFDTFDDEEDVFEGFGDEEDIQQQTAEQPPQDNDLEVVQKKTAPKGKKRKDEIGEEALEQSVAGEKPLKPKKKKKKKGDAFDDLFGGLI